MSNGINLPGDFLYRIMLPTSEVQRTYTVRDEDEQFFEVPHGDLRNHKGDKDASPLMLSVRIYKQ